MTSIIILFAFTGCVCFFIRSRRRLSRIAQADPMSTRVLKTTPRCTLKAKANYRIPGRRTILVSSAMAFLSLFMSWGDFFFIHKSGLSIGAWLVSITWIYPLIAAKNHWPIHAKIAKICAISSMIAGIFILAAVSNKTLAFLPVFPGAGISFYLLSSVFLYSGVVRYGNAHSFTRVRVP